MKIIATPLMLSLALGLLAVLTVLVDIGDSHFGVFKGLLLLLAVLLGVWSVAMLLNLAIFAPVYWLLGRIQSKKIKTKAEQ